MSDRFFIPHPITTERVTLDGPEAHHLLNVMRAAAGAKISLFDGTGYEYVAVVETVRRADAELRIVDCRKTDRELPFELIVGVALPKGDRQKWLAEKLTELGATALVPLVTHRGVAQPASGVIERLSRSVIEAAKQCGRNRLMRIMEPQNWGTYIPDCNTAEHESARRLVAHPSGAAFNEIDLSQPRRTFMAIGPEGGLSEAEVAMTKAADWQVVSLGPRILRVETAAIALAAAFALTSGQ